MAYFYELVVQVYSKGWFSLAYDLVKTAFRFCLRLRHLRSAYDLVKTRLSESEAKKELNQSQSVGMCIAIGLSFCFCFQL